MRVGQFELDDPDAVEVSIYGPDAIVWAPDEDRAIVRASVLLAAAAPATVVTAALVRWRSRSDNLAKGVVGP